MWATKVKFEDLMLDVENLSKTNAFNDYELVNQKLLLYNNYFFLFSLKKKENLNKSNLVEKINNNPNEKLLENIKEARGFIELIRNSMKVDENKTMQEIKSFLLRLLFF